MHAQETKFGKVTVAELEEKAYPADTSAAAAILFKTSMVTFMLNDGYWRMTTETAFKIKIYKKSAYYLADFEMSYQPSGRGDEVHYDDCATYNLVNGKVEKSKLKSDGEFIEKASKYTNIKKITLPNVKEGSIIEIKYIKHSYNITKPDICYFQYEIPVKYAQYKVYFPIYMAYNVTTGGYLKAPVVEERQQSTNGDYQEYRRVYTLRDVPALKDEAYVNNINNYRSRIVYELSSIANGSGQVTNYATDWESVAKKIYDSEDFGPHLKSTGYFEEDIDQLIAGVSDRDEKIKKIFEFVQSRMNWNDYYGYYCDEGVRSAYKKKTGNVGDINLMLTAMLRYAGLSANPVLISTRSNGIQYYPSRAAFNYVIAAVEVENDLILLDATSKNSKVNVLPLRVLNWFGRIIRKEGSSAEVRLVPKFTSKQNVNIMAKIDETGSVTGNVREQLTDYGAFVFRERLGSLTKESIIEKLESFYPGLEIGEFDVSAKDDTSKPVTTSYSFTHNNVAEIIGNKMYISPLLFFCEKENPFKQEIREYPVDFDYPKLNKFAINVTLPSGYEVESLPAGQLIQMEDNLGQFKYNITKSNNQIQLLVQSEINEAIIPSEYYDMLKIYYKELIAKENEKIILRKI